MSTTTSNVSIPKEHKKALFAVAWLTKLGVRHKVKVTVEGDSSTIELVVTSSLYGDYSFIQLFFNRSNWSKQHLSGVRRNTEKCFAYQYDGISKFGSFNLKVAVRTISTRYTKLTQP